MKAVSLDSQFYELTKEQMEDLSPSDIRLILRKAFDTQRSGMGPGPTMAEVIKHYNEERNYRIIRNMAGEDHLRHTYLDQLLSLAVMRCSNPGSLPWLLPTIVAGFETTYEIGFFDFTKFEDNPAYKAVAADLVI